MKSPNHRIIRDASPTWERLQTEFLRWAEDLTRNLTHTLGCHHNAVLPADTIDDMQEDLHKLKGAAGLAGYVEIAQKADELHDALTGRAQPAETWEKSHMLHQFVSGILGSRRHVDGGNMPASEAHASGPLQRLKPSAAIKASILVVCASTTILHLMAGYLESLPCSVQMATNAKDGFRIFSQARPDIVMICSALGNEEGVKLARRIATYREGAAARIVFLTGNEEAKVQGLQEDIEVVSLDRYGRARIKGVVERRFRDGGMTTTP